MADTKLPALTEVDAVPADTDLLYLVDVSDTADDATGSSRKIKAQRFATTDGSAVTFTGGGTIALGGYTLTVGATGTVALATGNASFNPNTNGTHVFGYASILVASAGALFSTAALDSLGYGYGIQVDGDLDIVAVDTAGGGGNIIVKLGATSVLTLTDAVVGPRLILHNSESPASNAAGTAGSIIWDTGYLYVCTSANTWKRVALTGGY